MRTTDHNTLKTLLNKYGIAGIIAELFQLCKEKADRYAQSSLYNKTGISEAWKCAGDVLYTAHGKLTRSR